MAALTRFGCFIRHSRTFGELDPIIEPNRQQLFESPRIAGSVTDGSDAVPVERWRAACYRQDAVAVDVGMHRSDWRVEPQAQQVTTRVLRRIAVVKGGARMQDRVV